MTAKPTLIVDESSPFPGITAIQEAFLAAERDLSIVRPNRARQSLTFPNLGTLAFLGSRIQAQASLPVHPQGAQSMEALPPNMIEPEPTPPKKGRTVRLAPALSRKKRRATKSAAGQQFFIPEERLAYLKRLEEDKKKAKAKKAATLKMKMAQRRRKK